MNFFLKNRVRLRFKIKAKIGGLLRIMIFLPLAAAFISFETKAQQLPAETPIDGPLSFAPSSKKLRPESLKDGGKRIESDSKAGKSPLFGDLPAGPWAVGFRVIDEQDGSRSFPRKSGDAFAPAARPLKISVWYPARVGPRASPMPFRDYLYALENASTAAAKRESETRFKTFSVAQELPAAAVEALLATRTASFREALPPTPKTMTFPVVVFGQGLFYESPITHTILCEFLASHGFIVATAPLVGAHSPFVKLDPVDLEAQIRDLEFVIGRTRQMMPGADREKLAAVGFDMGGLAASILAMRNADVDAMVSLDSGIMAEHNLRLVKAMPDYDPSRLRIPLLHATHPTETVARFGVREDLSFLDAARFSDRLILRLGEMRHADYTSRSLIETVAAEMRDAQTVRRRKTFELLARYVLAFLNANLKQDRNEAAFLERSAEETADASVKIAKERRKPARAPISEAEFINRLYDQGAARALGLFRKLRAEFPGEQIFREAAINQLGYNRLWRGEISAAIDIFTLITEAYPESANAFDSLAEAYAAAGRKEEAIRHYRRSLALDPRNENARERLKRLEEQK